MNMKSFAVKESDAGLLGCIFLLSFTCNAKLSRIFPGLTPDPAWSDAARSSRVSQVSWGESHSSRTPPWLPGSRSAIRVRSCLP